jgi:hypothetical protein
MLRVMQLYGFGSGAATSAPPTSPVNTAAPVISGTTTVGSTLSTTDGTWTGTPTPTFTYQWKRGGTAISGATSNNYALVTADAGATITVTVTATNTAGSASATSTGVGPIIATVVTTWNPSDKSANIILSGGNLTAGSSSGLDGAVRSTLSQPSGKKFYFEITWAIGSFGGDTGCGIATGSASLGMGATSTGALLAYCGSPVTIWFNGSSTGVSIGAVSTSSVVCFAIDLVNSRAWARVNGGNWNGSGTANPATNTGGINIAALFPTNVAFAVMTSNNNVNPMATVNFGASGFAQTPPSGFAAWNSA